jgi:hypothetical protein
MNIECSSDLTFMEKFSDRLTMGKHIKKHLNQFAVKEVETDNSSSLSSRVYNAHDMEKIIEMKV